MSSGTPEHSWDDLITAAHVSARQRKLGDNGICLASLRFALLGAPHATARFLIGIVREDSFFKGQTISGRAYAKKPGIIEARQIRAITPPSSILILFDCLVDAQLRLHVDAFAKTVGSGYMETAIRGRQILDATFSLSQHVEKTLDTQSQGCIAAADVLAYFDHLDPLRIVRWLLRQRFPAHLAATLLRLHCLPQITLSLSHACEPVLIRYRTSGFFTGTRTAGTASRIPLLDAASFRLAVWDQLSSAYNGVCFSLVSFVDNVYATGRDPVDAITISLIWSNLSQTNGG